MSPTIPEDRTTGPQAAALWREQLLVLHEALNGIASAKMQIAAAERDLELITARYQQDIAGDTGHRNAEACAAALTLALAGDADAFLAKQQERAARERLFHWSDLAELARADIRRLDRLIDIHLAELDHESTTGMRAHTASVVSAIKRVEHR